MKTLRYIICFTLMIVILVSCKKTNNLINTLRQENLNGNIKSIELEIRNKNYSFSSYKNFEYSKEGFLKEETYFLDKDLISSCEIYNDRGQITDEYSFDGSRDKELYHYKYIIKNNNLSILDNRSFYYNDEGLKTMFIAKEGDTIKYYYNEIGILKKEEYTNGVTYKKEYQYDENDNLISINTFYKDKATNQERELMTFFCVYTDFDIQGNWTKRRVSKRSIYNMDLRESTETRYITYWDGNKENKNTNKSDKENIPKSLSNAEKTNSFIRQYNTFAFQGNNLIFIPLNDRGGKANLFWNNEAGYRYTYDIKENGDILLHEGKRMFYSQGQVNAHDMTLNFDEENQCFYHISGGERNKYRISNYTFRPIFYE